MLRWAEAARLVVHKGHIAYSKKITLTYEEQTVTGFSHYERAGFRVWEKLHS